MTDLCFLQFICFWEPCSLLEKFKDLLGGLTIIKQSERQQQLLQNPSTVPGIAHTASQQPIEDCWKRRAQGWPSFPPHSHPSQAQPPSLSFLKPAHPAAPSIAPLRHSGPHISFSHLTSPLPSNLFLFYSFPSLSKNNFFKKRNKRGRLTPGGTPLPLSPLHTARGTGNDGCTGLLRHRPVGRI